MFALLFRYYCATTGNNDPKKAYGYWGDSDCILDRIKNKAIVIDRIKNTAIGVQKKK